MTTTIVEGIVGWARPESVFVPANRQRQLHNKEAHILLVESILEDGLIQPIVVDLDAKQQLTLVAGERRLRACKEILALGSVVRLVNGQRENGCIPVIVLSEQPERIRRRIELSENIKRLDLTWQEKVRATNDLAELFRLDEPEISAATISQRAGFGKGQHDLVATRQMIGEYMYLPQVAGAPTEGDAKKAVAKHLEGALLNALAMEKLRGDLAEEGNPMSRHTLLQGEAAVVLQGLDTRFDVILTDPPYGIGADSYSHNGAMPTRHHYDDSAEAVRGFIAFLPGAITRVAKEQAHLYLFCDISFWLGWKTAFEQRGWEVYRQPMVWVKGKGPVGSADVWPAHAYECILYAVRGRKPTQGKLATDVLAYAPVENRVHAAQKPVGLYEDLLRRSVLLNDKVLDCFCGSGTIFEAADRVDCVATGVDTDIRLAQRRLAGEKEIGE